MPPAAPATPTTHAALVLLHHDHVAVHQALGRLLSHLENQRRAALVRAVRTLHGYAGGRSGRRVAHVQRLPVQAA